MKKTKILATVGPASSSVEQLEGLIRAGVDVFRMNFSHGDHDSHFEVLGNIRQAIEKTGKNIGVLQDICGPKVRVKRLETEFHLKENDFLIFHKDKIDAFIDDAGYHITISQSKVLDKLQVGEYVYLCDGKISTKVVEVGDSIKTVIESGGVLSSNKGVNFPNTKIDIDVITKKDKKDIEWGIKNGVDFIAISFVQNANDVNIARKIMNDNESTAQLFSKIEKFDAIENIDEIIACSDGIMVARGDLGIEIPYYKVPTLQKQIIKKANDASKPVITATQMLLSMVENETATRAEISDVANAVLDGTDVVMLSEESAVGKNPIKAVETMTNTIIEAEKNYPYYKQDSFTMYDNEDIILSSTANIVKTEQIGIAAIFAFTASGKSAKKISRYRPHVPIYAVAHSQRVAKSLSIVWGVYPIVTLEIDTGKSLQTKLIKKVHSLGVLELDKTYMLTAGYPIGEKGSTNLIRILQKKEIEYYLGLDDQ